MALVFLGIERLHFACVEECGVVPFDVFADGIISTQDDFAQSLDLHLLQPPSDARHARLRDYLSDLNQLYQEEPALSLLDYDPAGFSWIDVHDSDNSVASFMRKSKKKHETLVFVCNFTPVPRYGYRVGVPYAGEYYEVINSDATRYGGSGIENKQHMPSAPIYWQNCPHSLLLTLPPLATVILKLRTMTESDRDTNLST